MLAVMEERTRVYEILQNQAQGNLWTYPRSQKQFYNEECIMDDFISILGHSLTMMTATKHASNQPDWALACPWWIRSLLVCGQCNLVFGKVRSSAYAAPGD